MVGAVAAASGTNSNFERLFDWVNSKTKTKFDNIKTEQDYAKWVEEVEIAIINAQLEKGWVYKNKTIKGKKVKVIITNQGREIRKLSGSKGGLIENIDQLSGIKGNTAMMKQLTINSQKRQIQINKHNKNNEKRKKKGLEPLKLPLDKAGNILQQRFNKKQNFIVRGDVEDAKVLEKYYWDQLPTKLHNNSTKSKYGLYKAIEHLYIMGDQIKDPEEKNQWEQGLKMVTENNGLPNAHKLFNETIRESGNRAKYNKNAKKLSIDSKAIEEMIVGKVAKTDKFMARVWKTAAEHPDELKATAKKAGIKPSKLLHQAQVFMLYQKGKDTNSIYRKDMAITTHHNDTKKEYKENKSLFQNLKFITDIPLLELRANNEGVTPDELIKKLRDKIHIAPFEMQNQVYRIDNLLKKSNYTNKYKQLFTEINPNLAWKLDMSPRQLYKKQLELKNEVPLEIWEQKQADVVKLRDDIFNTRFKKIMSKPGRYRRLVSFRKEILRDKNLPQKDKEDILIKTNPALKLLGKRRHKPIKDPRTINDHVEAISRKLFETEGRNDGHTLSIKGMEKLLGTSITKKKYQIIQEKLSPSDKNTLLPTTKSSESNKIDITPFSKPIKGEKLYSVNKLFKLSKK